MSAESPRNDQFEQVMAQVDQNLENAEDAEDYEEIVKTLRDRLARQRAEFRMFRNEVEQRFDQLEDQIQAGGTEQDEDAPAIIHLSNVPVDQRDEVLSTSEEIAVTIHENWGDIAWQLGDSDNRRVGVDTKTKANAKHNPSKIRHRLKAALGHDVRTNEIYRGLKRLADRSGGTEYTKDDGARVEIIGGIYRYEERPTADNSSLRRVLWRDD